MPTKVAPAYWAVSHGQARLGETPVQRAQMRWVPPGPPPEFKIYTIVPPSPRWQNSLSEIYADVPDISLNNAPEAPQRSLARYCLEVNLPQVKTIIRRSFPA
jgi:hypothetical protein